MVRFTEQLDVSQDGLQHLLDCMVTLGFLDQMIALRVDRDFGAIPTLRRPGIHGFFGQDIPWAARELDGSIGNH